MATRIIKSKIQCVQAKKRQDKDIEIKDLHYSLRMPGDPENQAPESPQTARSFTNVRGRNSKRYF